MKKRIITVVLSLMVIAVFMPTASFGATKMQVKWFNVGAGDSMFVKFPSGKTALIDAGTVSKGSVVVSKLRKMSVKTITYCISTHPDADHVGGLQKVFKSFKIKNFYYPSDTKYDTITAKTVMNLARQEGCKMISPRRGKKLSCGNGATLTFVQSNRNYSTDNEDSLAMFINYGKLQILTCGDNEKGSEEAIQKHNVDVLQLPHHGSKYATSSKFLRMFDPERVVVSTDGHKYGHPNKEVFSLCKKYDSKIKVYRTDKKGDIVINATKSKWKFTTSGVSPSRYTKGTVTPSPSNTGSGSVYITRTGTKYHSTKSCRGLFNATSISSVAKSVAIANGLTQCKLCW